MNLLLIGNYLSGPGYNHNVWQDLAGHLPKVGFGVITTSSKEKKIPRLLDMLKTIWLRRNDYQIAQIDVFSGQAFIFAECSARLLRALNKPFILTLNGGNLPQFSQKHFQRVQQLLTMADAVTAPSMYLLDRMAICRSDIQLLPNPIEISNYPFRLRKYPKPAMIWLRAFHHVYNPTMAPRVLANILNDYPTASLVMIGPDKGDHSLQNTMEVTDHLGVEQKIKFPGAVLKSEVPMELNQGDVFINTTNFDNTPTSVVEAMACGLCVISTNVGGLSYLLNDGEDALLVPPDDPVAMGVAARRVLSEPGLAERLSQNGREKAEKLDWANILPLWNSLFMRLINEYKR